MPGVHIVTIHNVKLYSHAQLDFAARVAYELDRGKFWLTVKPSGEQWDGEEL